MHRLLNAPASALASLALAGAILVSGAVSAAPPEGAAATAPRAVSATAPRAVSDTAPRASAATAPRAGAATPMVEIVPHPGNPPGPLRCLGGDAAQMKPCRDLDLRFYEGKAPVQGAYDRGDHATLDGIYERWCTGRDRWHDGRWRLEQFGEGLTDRFNAWKEWGTDLDRIRAWQRARPESAAARFAEAVYWRQYAWVARGTGFASSVSREGWELYRERLASAEAALATEQVVKGNCPAPQSLRIQILIDRGAPETELRTVYLEAARRWPENHEIHLEMARHFLPRWGGSPERFEAFASAVAEMTRDFEGMGMYARIYWRADGHGGIPFARDAGRPPHRAKLKAGWEDLLARHPASLHLLGKFTDVACRSDDGALYRTLRTRLVGYERSAAMVDPVDVCDRRHQWREKE